MVAADEFPDVLIAKHISKHLHLSVEQVYNLFRLSPAKGAYRVSQSEKRQKARIRCSLSTTEIKRQAIYKEQRIFI